MALDSLTDQQRAMLELEGEWFATAGGKDAAIAELGMRPLRYYQRLSQLIGSEAALAYAPTTVHRLRRLSRRSTRQLHSR